jgi:PAS domain S-box-containing protein
LYLHQTPNGRSARAITRAGLRLKKTWTRCKNAVRALNVRYAGEFVTESFPAKSDFVFEDSIPQDSAPLESILCTDELHRRPRRAPDYERENRALVALISTLADSPATILQTLAETILEITQSESSGLSLLTKDGKTPDASGKMFFWPAVSGVWNPHVGAGTPRNFGPCGDALDQNRALLFRHFERRYPYLMRFSPAAEECLLVPFYVAGGAVGTLWTILHSDRRAFDAEDTRIMASLAKFASTAYQALTHLEDLRFQEKYRLLVETASDAIVSIDVNGSIVFANPAFTTVFGYDPTELIGKPLTLLMPEYMRRPHESGFSRYLATGQRHINWQGTELIALRKNGEEFPIEVSFGELTRDGLKLFTGFLRDISKRKQAEIALRAATEERSRITAFREEIGVALSHQDDLKGILHNCAGAMVRHLDAAFARIWTLSGDGRELELQASAGMYTHLDGLHSRIPVGQHKIGRIAQERKSHLTNDAQNDPRVSDKDWARREKITSFAGYPLLLEDRLVGVMGMFSRKPLTESTLEALSFAAGIIAQGIERRRAEDALRRSEAFLAEGQRLGRIGSYSWHVATDEIKWSNELYRIYDLEIGAPLTLELIRTRVHPQDLSLYEKMLAEARNGRDDFEWQFRLMMPDQSIKYLHSVAHATRDQNDQLEYIAVVQDVTERRQSEEALERSRSELAQVSKLTNMGEMAASIAHEVNQPLTAVTNNGNACLRLLANHSLEPDVLRRALEEIVADGTRASAVIARIRAFLKKKPPEMNEIDLNEVIHETVALAGRELLENRVRIEYQLTQPLPLVSADAVQMQQVLLNLIMNAAEAMTANDDQSRMIHLGSAIDESGDVLVSVRDSGAGLGSEPNRIFTPFYTTKANGMGMGLSISRSLVEGHGGRLWAKPNSPRGADFSFTLPVAAGSLR